MLWLIPIPFILQTVLIAFDEFYYHRKRGLPKWERVGHPIDTLSVIACFAFVLFIPFQSQLIAGYAIFSFFSCLLVTKDEFVHKEHCSAHEQWLHSLLFINHPIVLALLGFLWPLFHQQDSLFKGLLQHEQMIQNAVWMQGIMVSIFFLYQVIYWNFYAKKTEADKQFLL